jgi:hypothetical protein
MNSAFLKLAKEDSELISEMKLAIKTMFDQAKQREMCYLAIEHNTNYLAMLAEQAHTERVIAVNDARETRQKITNMITDYEAMKKTNKALQKESDALVVSRQQNTDFAVKLAKATEKEENLTADFKDMKKTFTKINNEHKDLVSSHDTLKDKHLDLQMHFDKLKVELKEMTHICTNATEQN